MGNPGYAPLLKNGIEENINYYIFAYLNKI